MNQEETGAEVRTDEEAARRALSEQQLVRRDKLAKLQAEGRDPFAEVHTLLREAGRLVARLLP